MGLRTAKSMHEETKQPNRKNLIYRFDSLVKRFIPNFNVRAIIYFSLIFAVAIYLQVWRISSHTPPSDNGEQETVIADKKYWDSKEYKEKIQKQTVESFTTELKNWLENKDQEFSKRKFEDMIFINRGLTKLTNDEMKTLEVIIPESFNYLENIGRARYQYAKTSGFLADQPTLIQHGVLVCDADEKVEKDTGIELYEWRYASMPKLAAFMQTNPNWKLKVGDNIFDVSDPRIENKDVLKLDNEQTQPVGLFSFLVFRLPQPNRIFLADSVILQKNGVDDALTMARLGSHLDKQPKLYFKYGYEGCRHINDTSNIDYGQPD